MEIPIHETISEIFLSSRTGWAACSDHWCSVWFSKTDGHCV